MTCSTICTSCSPNNSPATPRAAPARSSDKQLLAGPAIVVGKARRQRIRAPQLRRKSCSASNRSRRVWIAKHSFASTLPSPGPVPHANLCRRESPLHVKHNPHKARAGSICRARRQACLDDNSKPMLFSDQLHYQFPLARAVIEIDVDNLLPCAER